MKKAVRYPLQAGLCVARWTCKNVDKECCHPEPKGFWKEFLGYVECPFYEKKECLKQNK